MTEIVEVRPGRHFTVEFRVRCTCGYESAPYWYRETAENRKASHERLHRRLDALGTGG